MFLRSRHTVTFWVTSIASTIAHIFYIGHFIITILRTASSLHSFHLKLLHAHTHTHIYIYIHTHTYIYIYIYIIWHLAPSPAIQPPLDMIILTMFYAVHKFRSFSLCTFLHSLVPSHPLGPNTLLSILCSNSVYMFPLYGDGFTF